MIDDDEDWLVLMQVALEHQGLKAESSVNGIDLWDKITTIHPDIILMDLAMQGASDGQKFCKQLKSNQDTCCIPIIILSSDVNIEEIAANCGADSFVSKSTSVSTLKNQIINLLSAA
jgi:CheY-like chemotaxis protein